MTKGKMYAFVMWLSKIRIRDGVGVTCQQYLSYFIIVVSL